MKGTSTSIAAAALAVALISTAGAATAAPTTAPAQRTGTVSAEESADLATGLVGPLRVAVGRGDTAYVSQNFGGQLTSVSRKGDLATLLDRPGIEIGGVSTNHSQVYFTESAGGQGRPGPFVANLSVLERGTTRVLADLAALEELNNYDLHNSYGFQDLDPECRAQIPEELAALTTPRGGDTYSHPYSTAVSNSGRFVYVADAGANAIFTVDTRYNTVTAKVLAPVVTPMTPELYATLVAQNTPLPECVIGATYNAEPVPTDIELSRDGGLYFTSLPGIPEDPTLGSVQRLDPASGDVDVIASGLTSPTGLALDNRGNIFVAELFAGRISLIAAGTTTAVKFLDAAPPADVEIDGKYLYSTTNALPGESGPAGTLTRTRLDYRR